MISHEIEATEALLDEVAEERERRSARRRLAETNRLIDPTPGRRATRLNVNVHHRGRR